MGKIRILDDHTANKIAAGEVVERPASVVKELIENSIDAGSTRIEVRVTGGGLDSITVTDNGEGMPKEDVLLAFSRHATSKISQEADLDTISTLGFRGEALPSIAAVAAVEMKTRSRDSLAGTFIKIQGGRLLEEKETGCPAGTSVTVTELFNNVPARLKNIKSPSIEMGHISDTVNRLAIAYPRVSFTLTHECKTLLNTTGQGDLLSIIASIYGTDLAKNLIIVQSELEGLAMQGFVGKPLLSRASRSHQLFVMNNRVVRSLHISQALEQAYHSLMMVGRRPVAFLNYTIPYDLVDPNVHPSKAEVRLYVLDKIVQLTEMAARRALSSNNLIPETLKSSVEKPAHGFKTEQFSQQSLKDINTKDNNTRDNNTGEIYSEKMDADISTNDYLKIGLVRESENLMRDRITDVPAEIEPEPTSDGQNQSGGETAKPEVFANNAFPELYPLCQIDNTYIVAKSENGGFYLVDKHAAHERILYEKAMNTERDSLIQMLAVPEHVQLTHLEAKLLVENILEFRQAGFIVEHFGGDSFLLRGVPQGFRPGSEKKIFLDLLDYFFQNLHKLTNKQLHEGILIMMSCKAAIKAGQRLTQGQMEILLADLGKAALPYTCPHGRPTTIYVSGYELQKWFKRVT